MRVTEVCEVCGVVESAGLGCGVGLLESRTNSESDLLRFPSDIEVAGIFSRMNRAGFTSLGSRNGNDCSDGPGRASCRLALDCCTLFPAEISDRVPA